MVTWEGNDISEAIDQWGPPDEEREVAGFKSYLWHRGGEPATITTYAPAAGTVVGQTVFMSVPTTTQVSTLCTRQLYFDEEGLITHAKWEGGNCCVMTVSGWCATIVRQEPQD